MDNHVSVMTSLGLALLCGSCAGIPRGNGDTPPAIPGNRTAYVEAIDGTTLELVMVPVIIRAEGGSRTLWVSRTEITWDLLDVFIFRLDDDPGSSSPEADAVTRPSQPYLLADHGYGHNGYACISLSWRNGQALARWLTAKTSHPYRLPTENEWRQLAAGSSVTPGTLEAHAWTSENAAFTTHPVGSKAPDALGLHDLFGNVAEWVSGDDGEWYIIGGSFLDPAEGILPPARTADTPMWNENDPQLPRSTWWLTDGEFIGFRLVSDVLPDP